jgi:hypothetical protein
MGALTEGAIHGTAKLISGWNDYLAPGLNLPRSAGSAPAIKPFRGNLNALAFAGNTGTEETWCSIHILHDYKPGTKIYPHVHWSHDTASPSGDVKWQIEYSVAKGHSGGVFPAATTISLIQTAEAQYTHQIIETSDGDAIDATNLEPDTVILFRLFRDANDGADTFENDAFMLYLDIHLESDRILTNEKVSPFTKTIR